MGKSKSPWWHNAQNVIQQAKKLEADHLIIRHEYPGVPPKVEYCLSETGHSLMPVLQSICRWGLNICLMNPL